MTPILYSALPLDRAHRVRRDPEALARLSRAPSARIVPFWRGNSFLAEPPAAVMATGADAARLLALGGEPAFLGMDGEAPVFALDLSGLEAAQGGPDIGLPGRWDQLRSIGPLLPPDDAAILAYARGLLVWQRRSGYCGACGAPARLTEGGHARVCTGCGEQIYPRTDPAVIMLVEDGDRVLMHRQPQWSPGMWSVLAGFVEPGETLEEAVAREVREETGILVTGVRYAGCQPWPFPSSLMMAFTARACGGTLEPDPHELEDARWFSRSDIDSLFDDAHRPGGPRQGGGLYLPTPTSIARRLVETWRSVTR
ncbi:MAG: NAD(+) diphosphatase [Solirubrobacterales bacterium]